MILLEQQKILTVQEQDSSFWNSSFKILKLCIYGVIFSNVLTVILKLARGEFTILINRKLYLYALLAAVLLCIIYETIKYIIEIKREKIKKTLIKKPLEQFFKFIAGFLGGQIIFLCLAFLAKDFSFLKNYIYQSFLGFFMILAIVFAILHWKYTKHERIHKTNKENRKDLLKEASTFIFYSIPGAVCSILIQIAIFQDFTIIYNRAQEIFIAILVICYLIYIIFEYRYSQKTKITKETLIKKINNFSDVTFKYNHFIPLFGNPKFMTSIYTIYIIISTTNPEFKKIQTINKDREFTLEDFYKFLKIIENNLVLLIDPKFHMASIIIIIENCFRTSTTSIEKLLEYILSLDKFDVQILINIITKSIHDEIVIRPQIIVNNVLDIISSNNKSL